MTTLPVLAAATAVVAFTISLAAGAGALGARRWLDRLAPAARSRILLAVAFAPALVGALVAASLIVDVYVFGCKAHHCRLHAVAAPSPFAAVLAALLLSRVGIAVARTVDRARRSRSLRRGLARAADRRSGILGILPTEEPQAFVLGLLRPRVYVSRGLLQRSETADLAPILAHERAHVQRRDPLRRLAAGVALASHLPAIAGALDRRLARAHEAAADAEAARVTGDPLLCADALLRLARMRTRTAPAGAAAAFEGSDLEARVRDLLAQHRPDRPSAAHMAALGLLILAAFVLAADPIHSGAEALLRLLAG